MNIKMVCDACKSTVKLTDINPASWRPIYDKFLEIHQNCSDSKQKCLTTYQDAKERTACIEKDFPPNSDNLINTCGTDMIFRERKRQKNKYTYEHDAKHNHSVLASVAAHFADPAADDDKVDEMFLFDWRIFCRKKTGYQRVDQLAIAGALCAAEIDRILRSGPPSKGSSKAC